jgi:NYN domain
MSQNDLAFPLCIGTAKIMMFVDGENLAIRYENVLGTGNPPPDVLFKPGVCFWSSSLNQIGNPPVHVFRRYYYTSVTGSEEVRDEVHDSLVSAGFHAPRVFHRSKGRGSKRVDISLSVEMLQHAHRRNFDIAILVAGDEDYVPLVDAVIAEGARVVLWFFGEGLSKALKRRADQYFDLSYAVFPGPDKGRYKTMHYHT